MLQELWWHGCGVGDSSFKEPETTNQIGRSGLGDALVTAESDTALAIGAFNPEGYA